MRVFVFVEGPSDRAVLEQLFAPDIEAARARGYVIVIRSFDGKNRLLHHAPERAAELLRQPVQTVVFVVPDLYPPNMGGEHSTFDELEELVLGRFSKRLRKKQHDDRSLTDRLHVHCFQHDLEVLLLAVPDEIAAHLGKKKLTHSWTVPVEDQNLDDPPKHVVERVFVDHGKKYVDTKAAPAILSGVDLETLTVACPMRFKPFAEELQRVLRGETLPA